MALNIKQERATYTFSIEGEWNEYSVYGLEPEWDWLLARLGKIDRIKFVRQLTKDKTGASIGLKDAKDAVEHHASVVKLPEYERTI